MNLQEKIWQGKFGKDYTNRNFSSIVQMNSLFKKNYGISRTKIIENFLGSFNRSIRILEVGCNIGNQLLCLKQMGFINLFGIELQSYAIEIAKSRVHEINIIQGSASNLPFKDEYFDLIFTAGLLIHIAPKNLNRILNEIARCTSSYIWGSEYFSNIYKVVKYRGCNELLWKTNFVKLYLNLIPNLKLVKEVRLQFQNTKKQSTIFLLKKK